MPNTSLFDTANKETNTFWLVYLNRENPRWWNKFLKLGFQHVQIWTSHRYGPVPTDVVWICIDPCLEMVDVKIAWTGVAPWEAEPKGRFQRVTTVVPKGRVRSWFHFGPITCVELAKAHIGVASPWVRTPWQLWKFMARDARTICY